MEILLKRIFKGAEYTIGKMYVDGSYVCDTIEDTDRGLASSMSPAIIAQKKVPGKTAIPTGRYPVVMTFSPRFKRQLPLIERTPGYSGVRIHSGNTAADTDGCILPGFNTKKGMVTNSRVATEKVISLIVAAEKRKEKVWLEII